MVTTSTPGGQRVLICTCTRMGRHLATFTRRPGLSLYTVATDPPQVAASAQVSASGQVATSCSCGLLSHQTLMWNHHLGHPSLPCLCGMHSRFLISGLPRSLPPLPPSPAPTCLPCVEGRQRATPHSSFPSTSPPLQTLHMDVWGPARVTGQGREHYTRYTTVFPLRSKGEVVDVLIPWIRTVRLQFRERFDQDLPVLRLHSDKGGEIIERHIGEVARTSMIYVAAPHFLWPFTVRYATHLLILSPCVSLLETSPILRWKGEVGDASLFRVWGSHAFVRDTSADKLFARAIPCVFSGFLPDVPGWQFYHPTSRRVLPSQDVTFDELVPFHCLFPYRSAPPQPPPLFLAPGPPPVDPLPPQGAARGAASGGAASWGAEPGGEGSEGAGSGGAERGAAKPEGVEPGGAESEGAESGGAEPRGAASFGGHAGASLRLSPHQLREWLARRAQLQCGAPGAGGAGDTAFGGAGVLAGAEGTRGTAATGPEGARTSGAEAAGTGGVGGAGAGDPMEPGAAGAGGSCAGGSGAGGARVGGTGEGGAGVVGARAVDPGVGDAGGTVRPRPYFVDKRVDYFQTFSPTPKMTFLRVLLHVTSQRDYELHSLDFSTAFLQGSLHEKIWLRHPPGFTGSFPAGTQWSLRRPVYGLRQVPRKWHDTLRTTLAALGFAPSTTDPSLFLCTDTSLPLFYVLVYVDDLVFATADIEALTLVQLCSYLGLQITQDRARYTITLTQSHMVHQVLQRFSFQFSSPQPTPLSTGHSLSAPP
ncbi:unnamed protein product [Closterium sp. NIES-54]